MFYRTAWTGKLALLVLASTTTSGRALADGYKRSPGVSQGLRRSALTSPFGARAGATRPLDAAFQARDPGPRWGRAPPANHGQQRLTTVSRPCRSATVSERSPRSSDDPDCLSHGGSRLAAGWYFAIRRQRLLVRRF